MRNFESHFVRVSLTAVAFGLATAGSYAQTQPAAKDADIVSEARSLADRQSDWMRPFVLALYRDGEWGAVLNLDRMGLAAMEKQDFYLARKSFDEAITRVEAIYANDANASKARSVFNAEKIKDFKGEPYERSMLYYYRGLLYAQEGDYQNARAAFLAADRHDALSSAEPGAYVGNFGLMKYLAGWASQCDGDTTRAAQLVGEARAADPKIQALMERPAGSIVLVDLGVGPVKWGDGQYKELLRFKIAAQVDPPVVVKSGTKDFSNALVAADVNFQATTRGGRAVDAILDGKAKFKGGADTVGEVAVAAGMQTAINGIGSGNNGLANAGVFGMLLGMVAKGVAAAATPAADIRAWDSLPSKVLVLQEVDSTGQPMSLVVGGVAKEFPINTKAGNCSIAWARTSSALSVDAGGTARFDDRKLVEANRGDRNRAFRTMLSTELVAAK